MGEKGYKAFKPGLICKDKQYQENTTFEEEGAENICFNAGCCTTRIRASAPM